MGEAELRLEKEEVLHYWPAYSCIEIFSWLAAHTTPAAGAVLS